MHITSGENSLIKALVRLRQSGAERMKSGHLLLTGRKMILEVAQKMPLAQLWRCEGSPPIGVDSGESYTVSEALMRKISGLEAPDGYAAVVPLPAARPFPSYRRVVALDGVGDPSNMGALLRSAWALGWDGALLLPGCCDPYNDKALRASRAAPLFFPWRRLSVEELPLLIDEKKMTPLAAQLGGSELSSMPPPVGNILLVQGSEGQGVSDAVGRHCRSVTIAIAPGVESLNVGAAAAIFLWKLR